MKAVKTPDMLSFEYSYGVLPQWSQTHTKSLDEILFFRSQVEAFNCISYTFEPIENSTDTNEGAGYISDKVIAASSRNGTTTKKKKQKKKR